MKRLSVLTLSLVPALLSAMSITEFVQQTIESHPQIQIEKESLKINEARLTQAKSGYLPTFDLSYSIGPEYTKTPANLREEVDMTRQEGSAIIKQGLFSGLSTVYEVEEKEALILSAGSTVEESANSLSLEATTAYLNVLKNSTLNNIARENVRVHDKYLQQIKEKVDAGLVRNSDYEQTLSRYESAVSAQYLAQQNYLLAVYGLERILPGANPSELEIPTKFFSISSLNADELVDEALKNNPTLKVTTHDIEAAKSAVGIAGAAYYPTADIELTAYANENVHGIGYDVPTQTYDAFETKDSGYNGMLVLNYNIFNGFADSANKEANQHIVLKQQATLADAKLFVMANTKIAWATYELTRKQLINIEKNIEASARTVSDYQQENELGRRSIIDLLNIELEYNNAKNRQANTTFDHLSAYYQILSHTGKILEAMNVSIK